MINKFQDHACLLLLLSAFFSQLSFAQNVLPADVRINGKEVWKAFEPQRQVLQSSSAVIYTDEKSRIKSVFGVVISKEGHIFTKASEIEGADHLSMRIGRDLYKAVEVLKVNTQWDVALLKIEPKEPLIPVVLSTDAVVTQGSWVISNGSASRRTRRVRVGVIAANARKILPDGTRVVLGILLETDDSMKISKVTPKFGAEKAGLKKGDVLKSVNGVVLKSPLLLLESLKGKRPGDEVEVEFMRGSKTQKVKIELMQRLGKKKMSRNDWMSGGENSVSVRRYDFPRIIQHDTPLTKSSVGGPLLNLDGKCIGMNIARSSRVATFAIPARELKEILEEMLK